MTPAALAEHHRIWAGVTAAAANGLAELRLHDDAARYKRAAIKHRAHAAIAWPCRRSTCATPAVLVAPDGRRYCDAHAPTHVELTITEHEDPT